MNSTVCQEISITVKFIDPLELQGMSEDDVVIVNRVRLNSKLVECEIKRVELSERNMIMRILREMKIREIKQRRTVMGPIMRVGDVKKLFPEYKTLPKNSFAILNS